MGPWKILTIIYLYLILKKRGSASAGVISTDYFNLSAKSARILDLSVKILLIVEKL